MKSLFVCVLLVACLVAGKCTGYSKGKIYGVEPTYVAEGEQTLAPKSEDYEVAVFVRGDEPDREYRVVGVVSLDTRVEPMLVGLADGADVSVAVLNALKQEARARGADALVDFTLTWGRLYAVGRAKAVVFE